MSIQKTINEDWKTSVKNKDAQRKKALTYIKSKLQEKAKTLKVDALSDDLAILVLRKMYKEQKDFVDNYGGEEASLELDVINSYLPQLMSEEAIKEKVFSYINSLESKPTQKEMGKVMGTLMKEFKGLADGALVRKVVQETLAD